MHGGELSEARVQVCVVEHGGMQLLIKPFLKTHGTDGFQVARAGSKGEAVEGVQNAVVSLKLGSVVNGSRALRKVFCGRVRRMLCRRLSS
jgi:hypothetical protein